MIRRLVLSLVLALTAAAGAAAQDNYEIQVYGADLVPRGRTMVELHSNFTFSGTTSGADGLYPSRHQLHETLEITHGFSDVFECGFYLFTSTGPGYGAQWVGTHIRPRFSAPERWHLPVGLSLSQEIGYQRREFSADTWTWEIRPIVDQTIGRFYWSFNPSVERALKGPGTADGVTFAPNAQVSVAATKRITAALEYYGGFGPVTRLDPFRQTEQQIVPAVNLDVGPEWELNLGVGAGLTRSTDRLLVKMIVGRRF